MPKPPTKSFPVDKYELANLGVARIRRFCQVNDIVPPTVEIVPQDQWEVGACAYYRPTVIRICLEECQRPCGEERSRNWTWPGSTVDREPFGVLCHELGHHVDWVETERARKMVAAFGKKIRKIPDYLWQGTVSKDLKEESGEKPITGYHDNNGEWFAEMFRVYCTNHDLLRLTRPKTWNLFRKRWVPVTSDDWIKELGSNVPARIISSNRRKFA